jgi:hypothetical protein
MYRRHSYTKQQKKIIGALALTRRILLCLAEGAKYAFEDYRGTSIFQPFLYRQSDWSRDDEEWAKKSRAKRALRQLKEKKFIETRKQGDKIMYCLTNKGRIAVLKDMIRIAKKTNDGKKIFVSFDIPEQENAVRVRLRYLLKDLKFSMIQRSLWASDLNVGDIIAKAIVDMKADKWVKVFESYEVIGK